VNATAPSTITSYTAFILQALLRDFTGKDDLKLTFIEKPLPFSLKLQGFINTAIGVLSAVLFAIAFMMISDTLI